MSGQTCSPPARGLAESLALACLLGLAAVLRLYDLGGVGFSGAEDYTLLAARGILEHGVPEMPSGALYPRALPYSYLVAASVALLGESEFSVRLPGALLGVAGVGLTWALARMAFGPAIAITAALVLASSDWEIATSRTARMYGPLSVAGLAVVGLAARQVLHPEAPRRAWGVLAGLVTGVLHRTSFGLVLPLSLLPLLAGRSLKQRLQLAMPAIALLGSSLLAGHAVLWIYARRHREIASPGRDADLYAEFGDLAEPETAAAVLATALAVGGAAWALRRFRGGSVELAWAGALAIGCLVLGWPVLAAYLWLGLFVWRAWHPASVSPQALASLAVAIAGGTLLWIAWLGFDGTSVLEASRSLLLRPRNFAQFHLLRNPAWVLLAGFVMVRLFGSTRLATPDPIAVLIVAAWWIPPSVLGLHPMAGERFYERYAFFTHAYLVILYSAGLWIAVGWIFQRWASNAPGFVRAAAVGVALLVSGGIDPASSLAAASPELGSNPNLRSARGTPVFFSDHAGTARYVCEHASPEDIVVATDALGHVLYCPHIDHQFTLSTDRDAETWLAGARDHSSLDSLLEALAGQPAPRVWLVVSQEERLTRAQTGRSDELERLLAYPCLERVYDSEDLVSAVFLWQRGCDGERDHSAPQASDRS